MIVFEIIGEIIVRIFVDFIFETVLVGFFRLLKRAFSFIKNDLLGIRKRRIRSKK